jgi:RNA polymerase sigma factor (sigma-70 family)
LSDLLPGELDVSSGLEIDDLLAAASLTDREKEVLELQIDGLKQVEIADRLGIAPGTVAALSGRAKQKLKRARSDT